MTGTSITRLFEAKMRSLALPFAGTSKPVTPLYEQGHTRDHQLLVGTLPTSSKSIAFSPLTTSSFSSEFVL